MEGRVFTTVDSDYCQLYHSLLVILIQFESLSPRMRNTGPGERRTTWQRNVLVTHGGWRRTRSRCVPPSWSGKTRHCGSKWPSCGKTAAAARTSWLGMRLSTARCKDLRTNRASPMRPKAELPSPQKSTQTQTPRESLNLHCCLRRPPVAVSSSEFCVHTSRRWGMMGSGGHRKACGERLAPTLREEGDDWGHSHGQTHTEKKNGPSLQTATTKSGNMKKRAGGYKTNTGF